MLFIEKLLSTVIRALRVILVVAIVLLIATNFLNLLSHSLYVGVTSGDLKRVLGTALTCLKYGFLASFLSILIKSISNQAVDLTSAYRRLQIVIIVDFVHWVQSIVLPGPVFERARVMKEFEGKDDFISMVFQSYFENQDNINNVFSAFLPNPNLAVLLIIFAMLVLLKRNSQSNY
jgi:hypothetical protein